MRRHWGYFKYVMRHKWFVLLAGLRVGVPLWRLIIHDWTKFTPAEWGPYARQFFGPDGKPIRRTGKSEEFERAWLHHQRRNPHHWQYWVCLDESGSQPLRMPWPCLEEMVADWIGAGLAIRGYNEAEKFYFRRRGGIQLHPDTREVVEALLAEHRSFKASQRMEEILTFDAEGKG